MQQVIDNWCKQFPQYRFTVFVQSASQTSILQHSNCSVLVISKKLSNKWQVYQWYQLLLPKFLKKHVVNICIQPYGITSLRSKVPQIVWADAALHQYVFAPHFLGNKKSNRFFTKLFLQKANSIVVSNPFLQSFIKQRYNLSNSTINLVSAAVSPIYQPIHWEKAELVKESYADAKAYFLYIASSLPNNNTIELLKAFSLFKKWQRSSMKLLITGLSKATEQNIATKLEAYKYKEDVVLLSPQNDENMALLIAAAYAVVYTDVFDGFGLPLIAALQSGVPAITTNEQAIVDITQNACLYTPVNDIEALSKQLILLYKDEILRSSLIQKGLQQAQQFSIEKTAQQLWQIVSTYITTHLH